MWEKFVQTVSVLSAIGLVLSFVGMIVLMVISPNPFVGGCLVVTGGMLYLIWKDHHEQKS